ncbi:patatin-like phospholipase family protein [Terrabacter terrae]|uniref:Patatin-like phospholipase family protein n=1 Tax=Terrabacter terrae TaxID=318434 RepID=A0ABN2UHG3_9MICO
MVTTAFVLTGGGSLGAVQVGMLTALHDAGVEPDLLVGTSVGAVNAAYLAGPARGSGVSTTDRLESLTALWHGLRRHDVFALEPKRWWGAARGGQPSMFSGGGLQRLLERHLGYDFLQDARIPVEVTVTDLVTGVGQVLDTGPVVSAVRASAAVPGVLPPVVREGATLVDGAIGELDVLGHTAGRGVADIYLLPAGYPCAGPPPATALGIALSSLSLLLHRQLMAQIRGYAGAAQLRVIPPLCPLSVSPADFGQTSALVRRAHRSTRDWLEAGGRPQDPSVLALHTHHPRPERRREAAYAPDTATPQPQEGLTR